MPCYSPLKAWPVGYTEGGKIDYKILPKNTISFRGAIGDPIEIPCGKCVGCRLSYSRQWADRCLAESLYHKYNYFLTLTYDDEHVPTVYYSDDETGEAFEAKTLRARDLQLWLKRFRKEFGAGIRFYACGEYGTKTFRPHYHVLLFGHKFDDLIPIRFERGNWYYDSPSLRASWKQGHVLVGDLTWESCAYVARYVMKKAMDIDSAFYANFNLEPEFVRMSRRPGIGRQFYEDHKTELYAYGEVNITTPKGGRKLRPSSYYDKLYDLEYPDDLKLIKAKRRDSAILSLEKQLDRTDLCKDEYLAVKEESTLQRLNKLIREVI